MWIFAVGTLVAACTSVAAEAPMYTVLSNGVVRVVDPKAVDPPARDRRATRRQVLATPEAIDANNLPIHHSRPSATNKIFLNFQGEVITDTLWNVPFDFHTVQGDGGGYSPITTRPFYATTNIVGPVILTNANRDDVTDIWMTVAEHFRPFDVDVTTETPAGCPATCGAGGSCLTCPNTVQVNSLSSSDDDVDTSATINGTSCGGRCKIPGPGGGGVAYVGAWGLGGTINPTLRPAFTYNGVSRPRSAATTVSHEAGHNFGLRHDGSTLVGADVTTASGSEYLTAMIGSGGTVWAPIMGGGFTADVTQWSDGGYQGATRPAQDDVSMIRARLGAITSSEAQPETTWAGFAQDGTTRTVSGIIGTAGAEHLYTFVITNPGDVTVSAKTQYSGADIHKLMLSLFFDLTITDSANNVVCSVTMPVPDVAPTNACALVNTPSDTYTVRMRGIGLSTETFRGDPLFTNYASLGSYSMDITPAFVSSSPTQSPTSSPSVAPTVCGCVSLPLSLYHS